MIMANYYFYVDGVYRNHNQRILNSMPANTAVVRFYKAFYFTGRMLENTATPPQFRNYYHSSNDELKLYLQGLYLNNIESVTFEFSNGETKQAAVVEQLQEDSAPLGAITTNENSFLQEKAIEMTNIVSDQVNNPTQNDQLNDPYFVENVNNAIERGEAGTIALVDAINEKLPKIEKANWKQIPGIGTIPYEGINLYYPIFLNSLSQIPQQFKFPRDFENPEGIDVSSESSINLKSVLGIPDFLVISETQKMILENNSSSIDVEPNLKPLPELTIALEAEIVEITETECQKFNRAKIRKYSSYPQVQRVGINSEVKDHYIDSVDGVQVVWTVWRDQIGLDFGLGPRDFKTIGKFTGPNSVEDRNASLSVEDYCERMNPPYPVV